MVEWKKLVTETEVDAKVSKSGDTMSGNLDFAKYKAIAMCCDNGTSFPATPNTGQWFYRSDIDTLFIYEAAWKAIISFGAVTLYVDGTNGSDAVGQGYATGAGATATIQYAIDLLPPINGGNVIVNVAAGTYNEEIAIPGNYITLEGAVTELESITSAAVSAGSAVIRGTITKASQFAGDNYANKLAYFVTDAAYRIIDGHASTITFNSGGTNTIAVGEIIDGATSGAIADVLSVTVSSGSWAGGDAAGTLIVLVTSGTWQSGENIDNVTDSNANVATTTSVATANNDAIVVVGTCPSSTAQDVKIYDWAVTIKSIRCIGQKNVILDKIKLINTDTSWACYIEAFADVTLQRCFLQLQSSGAQTIIYNYGANLYLINTVVDLNGNTNAGSYVMQLRAGSWTQFGGSKVFNTSASRYGFFIVMGQLECGNSVIDTLGTGALFTAGSSGTFYPAILTTNNRIRNCTTGIQAQVVSGVAGKAGNSYSGNTTNENAVAASFGYIG